MTGGRNWSQQQQGYVALRKAFDQGSRVALVIARSPCDEAIQAVSAEAVWIASLRSQ